MEWSPFELGVDSGGRSIKSQANLSAMGLVVKTFPLHLDDRWMEKGWRVNLTSLWMLSQGVVEWRVENVVEIFGQFMIVFESKAKLSKDINEQVNKYFLTFI